MKKKPHIDGLGRTREERAESALGALADSLILIAVLCFSAIAIVALALAAPIALAISAIAGLFVSKRSPQQTA